MAVVAAMGVHGVLLLGHWLLLFRVETRHVHAERLLAKAGVARCKGGVSPPLERESKAERKGRSAAKVCTSEARKIGEALAPREGSALRKVWFPYSRSSECMIAGSALRAGTGPQRWEAENRRIEAWEETYSRQTQLTIYTRAS